MDGIFMARSLDHGRHSGARFSANPESRSATSGFRVPCFAWSRNDGEGTSVRTDPVAMKSIGHAVAEMHQRGGTCFDVLRVEHRKVAAVLARAPHHREQPAVALSCILAALDKDRLGDGVA